MRQFAFFIIICWLLLGVQTGLCAVSTLLADTQDGTILSARNARVQQYPASLTKVMTLYLTFNALESGLLKMDDSLPISLHAAKQPASKMYLKAGETIRVRDAINALIVKSANDVAVVLAETLAPSEADFAKMMTQTAQKLGMKNTVFRNASGLHHPNQVTTAQDMAILTIALINHFPQYYKLFSKNEFTYRGKVYKGHNRVTQNYKGAEGLKTGYVAAVGYNIISTAKRNGQRFVSVVIGYKTSAERDKQAMQLLDKGFSMAKNKKSVLKKMQKQGDKLDAKQAKTRPNLKQQLAVMEKRLKQIKTISRKVQSIQLAKAQKSGQLTERSMPAVAALDEIEIKEDALGTASVDLVQSIDETLSASLTDEAVIDKIADKVNQQKIESSTEETQIGANEAQKENTSAVRVFSAESPVLTASAIVISPTDDTVAYQAMPVDEIPQMENALASIEKETVLNAVNDIEKTEEKELLAFAKNETNKEIQPEEVSAVIQQTETAATPLITPEKEGISNEKLLALAEPLGKTEQLKASNEEKISATQVAQTTKTAAKDTMQMRKASWGVQVGAFSNKTAAVNQANKALQVVNGSDKFVKITQTDKFYRSRIYGFKTKKSANLACRRLQSKKFNCMTLSPTLSYRD